MLLIRLQRYKAMSSMLSLPSSYEDQRKIILQCIREALNSTSVFERLDNLFNVYCNQAAHNIQELKRRTTKSKGELFEVFCMMYLQSRGYECWMLKDVPVDMLANLGLTSQDVGIDLIARIPQPAKQDKDEQNEEKQEQKYHYFAVQCKYRSPTKNKLGQTVHRVGWKDISTFLALCTRTGPWIKHIIMTNALTVSWKGKKTAKDYTIARNTFNKQPTTYWCTWVKQATDASPLMSSTSSSSLSCSSSSQQQRKMRLAWLDKITHK